MIQKRNDELGEHYVGAGSALDQIQFRLAEKLKEAIKKSAKNEEKSVNQWITDVVVDYLSRNNP